MTRQEIDLLVDKYARELTTTVSWDGNSTQYDDRSAQINYAIVREFKPQVVLEFGSRTGRCTHDILQALIRNGGDYDFRSCELQDDLRARAQKNINDVFGEKAIKIGGDVTKVELPENIEYLFIDNFHDTETTKWLFDVLLKKCRKGAIVQIHDINLLGNFERPATKGFLPETEYIVELHKQGKLPLKKMYWTWEEGGGMESSWWIYEP